VRPKLYPREKIKEVAEQLAKAAKKDQLTQVELEILKTGLDGLAVLYRKTSRWNPQIHAVNEQRGELENLVLAIRS